MPRHYHDECPECIEKELTIRELTQERDAARQHAAAERTIVLDLRREIQSMRMSCDTERIRNEQH